MTEPELPELPKPDGTAEVATGHMPVGTMKADITETIDAWSEPLVRAYGQHCYEAGVKAALARAKSRYDHEVAGAVHHAGRWQAAHEYHMTRQEAMSDLLEAIRKG